MKKIFNFKKSSLCLLALLLALFSFQIVYAGGEGTCEAIYSDSYATLTIKPPDGSTTCTLASNDDVYNYNFYSWADQPAINKVIIKEGVKTGASAANLFYNLTGVTDWVGLEYLDVSGSSNLTNMFCGCKKLTDLGGLANWNVENVENMSGMFGGCKELTDLSGLANWSLKVGKVTVMDSMFYSCYDITSLSGLADWDVSSVTNMYYMFGNCKGLTDLSGLANWSLKVSKVEDMSYMFFDCEELTSLNGLADWDVSSVTDMSFMFNMCAELTDLSALTNWSSKVSKVENMSSMFGECPKLTDLSALATWNVSSVTDMSEMFIGCSLVTKADFSGDNWDFSKSGLYLSNMLYDVNNAAVKLNQYNADMSGSNLYVVGKHNCSELGLSADPGNLIYEPFSVLVSFTGGTGTATLTENSYTGDYYDKVCAQFPNEAICTAAVKGSYNSGTTVSITNITPGNTEQKIVSVIAADEKGNKTTLAAPDYQLENIQSNYTVEVQLGYTLTYEPGAGVSGDVPEAKAYKQGATVTVAGAGNLSKTGYVFSCWEGTINGETRTYVAGETFTMPAADVTLTAVFNEVPVTAYTLTYEKGDADSGAVPAAAPYSQGATVTVAGNTGNLAKTGYVFNGWKGTIDGETKTYAAGETFTMPAANVTLTAQFKQNDDPETYTLTYSMGDATGGTLPEMQQAAAGESVTLPYNTGNLTYGSYPFIGWVDQNGSEYDEGQSFIMPAVSLSFKPLFSTVQYTLSYTGGDAESGTVPASQSVYYKVYTELAGNTGNLAKSGYAFKGWTDGTTEYAAGASYRMPKMNVTLKAVFEPNSFTLTYVSDGADSGDVPEAVTVSAGTAVTIAGNDGGLTKSGFVFFCWTDGIRQYRPGTELVMPQANVTLRPVFQEEYIKNPEPLPEDEIGTYSFDENGMKIYIQFHNYDICMVYMNDDNLCRNTSANLYN